MIFLKICLYGASSAELDKSYTDIVEKLGFEIAKRGHSLIFGGGAQGLMGAAARGAEAGGAQIIGVVPTFFNVDGILFEKCTEMIRPETMRER